MTKKKTMQDRRCLSCPSPTDNSDDTRLFFTDDGETDFGRMLLSSSRLRSPPSSSLSSGLVSLPDSEEAEDNAISSSSNSPAADSAPSCGTSVINSDDLATVSNGATGNLDSNEMSSEENLNGISSSRSNPRCKRMNWAEKEAEEDVTSSQDPPGAFQDGFSKSSAFRRSVSVKSASKDGKGDGARASFTSRRYESFRAAKDPTADLQPIRDPALLLKLQQSVTGLQLSQLHLSPKVSGDRWWAT